MSETAAINIPKRRYANDTGETLSSTSTRRLTLTSNSTSSSKHSPTSPSSSTDSAAATPRSSYRRRSTLLDTPSISPLEKGKGKEIAQTSVVQGQRRASLLSSSISKSEHTVVNVGGPDGPPRLITCVKASQGFDWNQDIFLPSYACGDTEYSSFDLERRQDPAHDIFISDEEAAELFPF